MRQKAFCHIHGVGGRTVLPGIPDSLFLSAGSFFLTLAYCISALFRRKGILRMFLYGLTMCAAIGAAVWLFPASLEHIFHGYRGEAALSVLVNGSFWEMCGIFLPVLNENVFAGMMWPLLLLSVAALAALLFQKSLTGLHWDVWQPSICPASQPIVS